MTNHPEPDLSQPEPMSNRVAAVRLRTLIAQQSQPTAKPHWLYPFNDPSDDDPLAEPAERTTPHPPEVAA